MPARNTFVTDLKRKASASVVLKLVPGADLGAHEVNAIVHLVASSVESLEPGSVTIVDNRGRLLAPRDDGGVLSDRSDVRAR